MLKLLDLVETVEWQKKVHVKPTKLMSSTNLAGFLRFAEEKQPGVQLALVPPHQHASFQLGDGQIRCR
jgi:hypothetical protein